MKKILIGIMVSVPLICVGLFFGDWIYSEIIFQIWLNQDELHVNFDLYNEEQLREVLLAKLPIGSSEEEVKAFYLANRKYGLAGFNEWQPEKISDKYGVVLRVWTINHGNIIKRMFSGKWIISFYLDPTDHSLIDIAVKKFGSEL